MFGIGNFELIFLALLALIIFGPKNLPKIGQALGRGIREFKDATQGIMKEEEDVKHPPQQLEKPAAAENKTQPGDRPGA